VLKKSESKFKIEKKNDKSNSKSVHSGANKSGDLATNLKTLSQLIGVLFWCDSSAKNFAKILNCL